jgi:hypothetical protein
MNTTLWIKHLLGWPQLLHFKGKLVNGSGSILPGTSIDRRHDICRLKIHLFISLYH